MAYIPVHVAAPELAGVLSDAGFKLHIPEDRGPLFAMQKLHCGAEFNAKGVGAVTALANAIADHQQKCARCKQRLNGK